MQFFQCRLRQNGLTTVGWIEARGARLGVHVDVPECGGIWRIAAVYQPPLDAVTLREKQRVDRKGMPTI